MGVNPAESIREVATVLCQGIAAKLKINIFMMALETVELKTY